MRGLAPEPRETREQGDLPHASHRTRSGQEMVVRMLWPEKGMQVTQGPGRSCASLVDHGSQSCVLSPSLPPPHRVQQQLAATRLRRVGTRQRTARFCMLNDPQLPVVRGRTKPGTHRPREEETWVAAGHQVPELQQVLVAVYYPSKSKDTDRSSCFI